MRTKEAADTTKARLHGTSAEEPHNTACVRANERAEGKEARQSMQEEGHSRQHHDASELKEAREQAGRQKEDETRQARAVQIPGRTDRPGGRPYVWNTGTSDVLQAPAPSRRKDSSREPEKNVCQRRHLSMYEQEASIKKRVPA